MKKRYWLLAGGLLVYAVIMNVPTSADEPPVSTRYLSTESVSATLDYAAGEMVLRTRIRLADASAPPDTVWLWAFFLNPDEMPEGTRSDSPIAIGVDFRGLDTATVEARGPFHWAGRDDIPRPRRAWARVFASSLGPDSAMQRAGERDKSVITMAHVELLP